jgi:hypothetical protein
MGDFLHEDNLCGQTILALVSRGNSVLAEMLRLATMVPDALISGKRSRDPQQRKYADVLFSFQYLKSPDVYEEKMVSNDVLAEVDATFFETYEEMLRRYYNLFVNVCKFVEDFNEYLDHVDEGFFISHTLDDVLVLDGSGKQLVCEALYLFGMMLLTLEDRIPGPARERIIVALLRQDGEQSLENFEGVTKLCRATGYDPMQPLVKPQNYPEEFFARFPMRHSIVRMVIDRLRSDDVYNMIRKFPAPEHRSVALANQASMIYVILYFMPSQLGGDRAMMREIVDKHFNDNWIITIYMGRVVNLRCVRMDSAATRVSAVSSAPSSAPRSTSAARPVGALSLSPSRSLAPPFSPAAAARSGGGTLPRSKVRCSFSFGCFHFFCLLTILLFAHLFFCLYPAALEALRNTLELRSVRDLAKRHDAEVTRCLERLARFLTDGVLSEDFVIEEINDLLNCLRSCNATVRWLLLHSREMNPGLMRAIYAGVAGTPMEAKVYKTGGLLNRVRKPTPKEAAADAQIWTKAQTANRERVIQLLLLTGQLEWRLKAVFESLLSGKEERWESAKTDGALCVSLLLPLPLPLLLSLFPADPPYLCSPSAYMCAHTSPLFYARLPFSSSLLLLLPFTSPHPARYMRELAEYFSGTRALSKVKADSNLQQWFSRMADHIEELDYEHSTQSKTGRKIQKLLEALREVEQFEKIDTSLQVKEFLTKAREFLTSMVKAVGVKPSVLTMVESIADLTYAWEILDDYVPVLHRRVDKDPRSVVLLRAMFLKLASIIDVPLGRILQANSADLDSVCHYYSGELVAFVRNVLSVVPRNVFQILSQIITLQTTSLGRLPAKLEVHRLIEVAQLDARYKLAKYTHRISVFTEGILAMEKTLLGSIDVDPRQILAAGIRKELVNRIAQCVDANIRFTFANPDAKKKKKKAKADPSLPPPVNARSVELVLSRVSKQLDGFRRSLEYIQDYLAMCVLCGAHWNRRSSSFIAPR